MNTASTNNPYIDLGKTNGATDQSHKQHKQLIASYSVIVMLSIAVVALTISNYYFAVVKMPRDYVLEVDSMNRVTYGGALDSNIENINPYIPNEIIRFVENWRMVTGDNTMQKLAVSRLYCMLGPDSAARARVDTYYGDTANNPFEINKRYSRTVNLRNILQQSELTWHVEFVETVRDHSGQVVSGNERTKAQLVITRGQPRAECMESNPIGTYITDINWSDVL